MNQLYYGDNLDILRQHIADSSVDLIYLDPPFNSNRSYNVLTGHRVRASEGWNRDYPCIQMHTIEQPIAGETFSYPQANVTLTRAEREEQAEGEQGKLL